MYVDPTLGHTITGVLRNEKGTIAGYRLEDGEVVTKEQAVILAKQGAMKGVTVEVSELGEEFIKSLPDNEELNNLENLPIVEKGETIDAIQRHKYEDR